MNDAASYLAQHVQRALERQMAHVFGLPEHPDHDSSNLTWARLKEATSRIPSPIVIHYFTDRRIPPYHVYLAKDPVCQGMVIGTHPDYIDDLKRQSVGVRWVNYAEWRPENGQT